MSTPAPLVWPSVSYDDAPGALRFLVDVVAFREALVVPDDSGDITHAQLRWPEGGGVMVGSTKYCANGPAHPGSASVYVVSDAVDDIHRRVRAAGAEIVSELEDTDYGSHTFTLRDAEGNLWTFGTYRGEA